MVNNFFIFLTMGSGRMDFAHYYHYYLFINTDFSTKLLRKKTFVYIYLFLKCFLSWHLDYSFNGKRRRGLSLGALSFRNKWNSKFLFQCWMRNREAVSFIIDFKIYLTFKFNGCIARHLSKALPYSDTSSIYDYDYLYQWFVSLCCVCCLWSI